MGSKASLTWDMTGSQASLKTWDMMGSQASLTWDMTGSQGSLTWDMTGSQASSTYFFRLFSFLIFCVICNFNEKVSCNDNSVINFFLHNIHFY